MIPSAPKFRKIILLLKDKNSKDKDIVPTVRIEHEDCAMIITGNYVIITEEENNNNIDTPSSIKGKIYDIRELDSYKLFKD
ncbi:hypothetical protein CL614_08150 [archaeon]|jgi:hypothetical protein|nr:hypothetical protein [archaeon]|tara:strand:- start:1502 stop:1744 length:243 start_codon:yes stop_codon:yes gene_type:complete